jgi:hypothetical protein
MKATHSRRAQLCAWLDPSSIGLRGFVLDPRQLRTLLLHFSNPLDISIAFEPFFDQYYTFSLSFPDLFPSCAFVSVVVIALSNTERACVQEIMPL